MNRAPLFSATLATLLVLAGCSSETNSGNTAAPESVSSTAAEPATEPVAATEDDAPRKIPIPRDAEGHIRPEALTQTFIDSKTAEARTAVEAFSASLKSELQAALKNGSPIEALSVCHTRAPEITQRISSERQISLSRVSLKARNPSNEAIGWQKNVLEEFETAHQAGKAIQALEHSEIVEINGRQVFRYMKAIPTGKLCLTCHGSNLSPVLHEKLGELYPLDKATGFREGDIRGAFVVMEKL